MNIPYSRNMFGVAATLLVTSPAFAAPITKAGADAELTNNTAWTGGAAPTSADDATWATGSLMGDQTVGSAVNWGTINVASTAPTGNLSLSGSAITLSSATLNGSKDVVINASTNAVTIANDLVLTGVNSSAPVLVGNTSARLQLNASGGSLTLGNVTSNGGGNANDANLWLRGSGTSSTINGTLTVDGQLAKGDSGTWTLNGANTIGWIFTNNGTLLAGHNQAFGSGTIYMNHNGVGNSSPVIASSSATARNFSNALDLTGGFNTTQSAVFGQTTGGTGALSFSGGVELGTAVRNVTTNASTTFAGVVTGVGGGITKLGGGTLTLSNANTYTGMTSVNAGILALGNNASVGTGILRFAGGTVASNNATARTISNAVEFTGGGTIGTASTGNVTFTGDVSLGAAVRTITTNSDATFSGVVSGTGGGITKQGTGTLTLSNANAYTGVTLIGAGTLAIGNNAALGTGGLRLDGGTLASTDGTARTIANTVDFASSSTVGSAGTGNLTFTGATALGNAAGGNKMLTVNNAVTEFSGVLSSTDTTGFLTKAGTGTLVLTGTNTYQKATTITAGTVITGNTSALGQGKVDLSTAGAVLQVGDGLVNSVTLGSAATLHTTLDSTLKLASTNSLITMGATGVFTLDAGTNLDITGLGLGVGDYVIVDGTVAGSTVGTWDQSTDLIGGDLANFNYTFFLGGSNDAILKVTAVPEPSVALLGGLAVLGLLRRRRA